MLHHSQLKNEHYEDGVYVAEAQGIAGLPKVGIATLFIRQGGELFGVKMVPLDDPERTEELLKQSIVTVRKIHP